MTTFQIVIPSLNQGAFIGEAVRSVLEQSRDVPLELVVVDGCSTDDTPAQVEAALRADHRARVTLVSERDRGQSEAINKGMALGSGEVVGWLNADDRLLRGTLARVARVWAAAPPGLAAVYGDVRLVDPAGVPFGELREQDFCRSDLLWGPCYIPQPSTFVARWAWEAAGGVREDLHYAMDLDVWLRLSERGRIVHLPEVLSEFRVHERSKSVAAARAARSEARGVRRIHATCALGRRPSELELDLRHLAVRCRRKARFGFRALRRAAA